MWLLWTGTFTRCAADMRKPHPIFRVGLVLSEEEVKEEEDCDRTYDRLSYGSPVV